MKSSGADPEFSWGGKRLCACISQLHSLKSLTAGVQGPLKVPGSPRVLDALSCYLSLIFKHSDTKGGGGCLLCLHWICHWSSCYHKHISTLRVSDVVSKKKFWAGGGGGEGRGRGDSWQAKRKIITLVRTQHKNLISWIVLNQILLLSSLLRMWMVDIVVMMTFSKQMFLQISFLLHYD